MQTADFCILYANNKSIEFNIDCEYSSLYACSVCVCVSVSVCVWNVQSQKAVMNEFADALLLLLLLQLDQNGITKCLLTGKTLRQQPTMLHTFQSELKERPGFYWAIHTFYVLDPFFFSFSEHIFFSKFKRTTNKRTKNSSLRRKSE